MERNNEIRHYHHIGSGGKELVAYTVEGTFAGEVAATLKSIEAERGIPQDKILVRAVMR